MIINDPIFGFIEIEKGLLTDLVKHPYFIRLTRLKQLGPTFYVYPGAMHTRFQHSVGTLHLVTRALNALQEKGICISAEEREGVEAAMLLHDLGHGPMSHAMEHAFVSDIEHEEISLLLMQRINDEMNGKLDMAIQIYQDRYPKHFLHELVCSQLDMDRLDYLSRDSFFTGVKEGNIGVARIIKMLNVKNDRLVVEQKGIYTIENYLITRRLMYWQVYLHKTAMAAQEILLMAIRRAQDLERRGEKLPCTPDLNFFLCNDVNSAFAKKHPEWLDHFAAIDDSDIETALKQWTKSSDKVLALLACDYTNRHLFKAISIDHPVSTEQMEHMRKEMARILNITEEEATYFVRNKETDQMLYSSSDDHIYIHFKDGTIRDISELSELISSNLIDKKSRRFYLFYQRCDDQFQPLL